MTLRRTGPLVTRNAFVVVGAIPVPDLPAGVAGVGEDLRDRPQGPCIAVTVRVTGRVVAGRPRPPTLVEGAGDRGRPGPGQSLGEDPPHMRRGNRIGTETVQPPAPTGVRRVGVRAGVHQ